MRRGFLVSVLLVIASMAAAACWGIGGDDRPPAPTATPTPPPATFVGERSFERTSTDSATLRSYVEYLRSLEQPPMSFDSLSEASHATGLGFRVLEPSEDFNAQGVTVTRDAFGGEVAADFGTGSRAVRFRQSHSSLLGIDFDPDRRTFQVNDFDVEFWSDDAGAYARFATGEHVMGSDVIAYISGGRSVHVVDLKEFIETLEFVGE